jgi:hypothetical protein
VPEKRTASADLAPSDVTAAASWLHSVASTLPMEGWDATPDDSNWSRRRTLDHTVDAMLLYSAYVATRARKRLTPPRNGDPGASPKALSEVLVSAAAILVRLLDGMTDGERAYHPSGLADRTGWIGMACTELLVHGHDLTIGVGVERSGPAVLADAVVNRVLPWIPAEGDGWARLLWATGRRSLGRHPPAGDDWWWQSAPLIEWDGQPRRRNAPPQW